MTNEEYFDNIARIRSEPIFMMIMITKLGGSIIDSFQFSRFLNGLRTDIDIANHSMATAAWLATCSLKGDADREKAMIRDFVESACGKLGWMKVNT